MMKRLFSLLLTAALLAALASGCAPGQSSSPGQTSGPDASIQSQGSVSSSPAGSAAHGDASPALPEDNTSEPAGDISQPAEEALPVFTGGELLTGDLSSMAAPIQALTRAMAGDGYTYDPYLPVFFWTSLQHALSLSGGDHALVQTAGDELQVPRQVAQEFATALFLNYNDLPPLPDTLPGIRYDEGWDAYFLGQEAAPSAIPIAVTSVTPGGSGSYLVDVTASQGEQAQVTFRFTLVPNSYADGITQPTFLYTVSAVECLSQSGSLTHSATGAFDKLLDASAASFDFGAESYRIFRVEDPSLVRLLEQAQTGQEVSLSYTVDFSSGACTITALSLGS